MQSLSGSGRCRGVPQRRLAVAGGTLVLLELLALPLVSTSYAEDRAVRFDPRIEAGGLYDDNYRLNAGDDDEIDVAGPFLDVALTTRFRSPTSELKLTPRVRTRYFPEDTDEDDTAEFLGVDYRSDQETTSFGGAALCSRQAVTSSERPAPDVSDPTLGNTPGVDTGLTRTRSTQRLCQVKPRFAYDVTTTSRIEVSAQYLDVNYSRERTNTPTDFDSLGGTLAFANDLNATNTLSTRLIASRFDPKSAEDAQSETYGAQFEWQRRTSATFEGYLRVGIERVSTDGPTGVDDADLESNDYVLGAGLRRDYQITQFFVDLSRAVAPNSSGQLVTRNQVKVRLRRDLSPTIAGFVSVLGIDDSEAEDDLGFRDRTYAAGTLGLEWRLNRRLSLVGEYGYTRQKYEDERDAAKSNRVALSVVYEPNRSLP